MIRRHPPQVPAVLWVPAVLALALVVLPVAGLLTRVEPARLPGLLLSPAALDALRLSVITGLIATALAALLGVPLAVVLARSTLPGMRVVRALVLLPLVLPPVVGGLALLYLLGRTGPLGGVLAVAGIRLPYTTAAVVLSQTFVAMPFLVVGLEGALRTAGGRYEQVAATLGAGPWLAFRRVTLPLLLPALGSSLVLTFARALGEFGATITFAGSLQGSTRTLPLAIYTTAQSDVDAAVAMSLLLVVVALLVIVIARPRAVEGRL
ncbi:MULTISPECIES: ABC transporter permease [Saccharopolyspora]|jgi:molybdate transport system permease protein|uniref:Molybdenum transport system permease n=1 Tax=Saccharopolyspora endophytica TaxID=543886 RepID=A0ABS5DR38_9PSEU|nr:ABC transporter permease [Saccharopolyspora endophytica]MBQ0928764.1 molybdate ABC transporter permease subunit [Saccharopolyspora endophytica]